MIKKNVNTAKTNTILHCVHKDYILSVPRDLCFLSDFTLVFIDLMSNERKWKDIRNDKLMSQNRQVTTVKTVDSNASYKLSYCFMYLSI